MTPRDLAAALLQKARDDAHVVRTLAADPKAADWVIGFHAQQAVEKSLKAVLTSAGIRTGRTHDLNHLLDLLTDSSIEVPEFLSEVASLGPYAVTWRYAELEVE